MFLKNKARNIYLGPGLWIVFSRAMVTKEKRGLGDWKHFSWAQTKLYSKIFWVNGYLKWFKNNSFVFIQFLSSFLRCSSRIVNFHTVQFVRSILIVPKVLSLHHTIIRWWATYFTHALTYSFLLKIVHQPAKVRTRKL